MTPEEDLRAAYAAIEENERQAWRRLRGQPEPATVPETAPPMEHLLARVYNAARAVGSVNGKDALAILDELRRLRAALVDADRLLSFQGGLNAAIAQRDTAVDAVGRVRAVPARTLSGKLDRVAEAYNKGAADQRDATIRALDVT